MFPSHDRAGRKLVKAIAENSRTADGEFFTFKSYGYYWCITGQAGKAFAHWPRLERVNIYGFSSNHRLLDNGKVKLEAYEPRDRNGCPMSYFISKLYYHEENAKAALREAREAYLVYRQEEMQEDDINEA